MLQVASFVIAGIVQLIALVSCYYGLKADNASLAAKFDLAIAGERADRRQEMSLYKASILEIVRIVEEGVKDLNRRVGTMETGQNEWTKSLRERTHELSQGFNTLVLKVDRLERPLEREK